MKLWLCLANALWINWNPSLNPKWHRCYRRLNAADTETRLWGRSKSDSGSSEVLRPVKGVNKDRAFTRRRWYSLQTFRTHVSQYLLFRNVCFGSGVHSTEWNRLDVLGSLTWREFLWRIFLSYCSNKISRKVNVYGDSITKVYVQFCFNYFSLVS